MTALCGFLWIGGGYVLVLAAFVAVLAWLGRDA